MDDLAAALRPLPAQMAANTRQLEFVTKQLEQHTEELRSIREDLAALHRLIAQIGWGLGFCVLAALVSLVVTS